MEGELFLSAGTALRTGSKHITLLRFRRLNFSQAPLQVSAFAIIGDQLQGTRIALGCFVARSDAAQEVGTCGVQEMVTVEIALCRERINKS